MLLVILLRIAKNFAILCFSANGLTTLLVTSVNYSDSVKSSSTHGAVSGPTTPEVESCHSCYDFHYLACFIWQLGRGNRCGSYWRLCSCMSGPVSDYKYMLLVQLLQGVSVSTVGVLWLIWGWTICCFWSNYTIYQFLWNSTI